MHNVQPAVCMSQSRLAGIGVNSQPQRTEILQKFHEVLAASVEAGHFMKIDAFEKLLADYNFEDLQKIYKDLSELEHTTFNEKTQGQRYYIVTAGGPASGKSTLLEHELSLDNPNSDYVYTDPDRSCMQRMQHTYLRDIDLGTRDRAQAYEHWRNASNFLANVFLARALKDGYKIAHGSTMATPYAEKALQSIREYGFHRTILHLTCEEDIRAASETKRREVDGIVQCTHEDFVNKQNTFYSLLPVYIKNAEKIVFYYRNEMACCQKAAEWSADVNKLSIYNQHNFEKIKSIHARQYPALGQIFDQFKIV